MPPTARSLVLDLLSALPAGTAVPVGSLIRSAAVFGIAAGGVRVALTRLCAAQLLESDDRGFYCLGRGAAPVSHQVRSWRTLEEGNRPWAGGWVGALTASLPRADRRALRRRARALSMLGFRPLEPGLEVRPDNLAGGVDALRVRLHGLGLEESAAVFAISQLDGDRDVRARELWDGRALEAAYRASRAELEESAVRLESFDREAAMAESFVIGGQVIRQLALDPLLPDPIVSARERRALVSTLRRYDRIGRRHWKGWTGLASISLEHSPAGVGGGLRSADAIH